MKQKQKEVSLQREEIKAIKLFLWLFYGTYIGYEFFYYVFFPYYKDSKILTNYPDKGLGMLHYILIISLLFLSVYLIKKGKPWTVKYLYFFGYSTLEIINNVLIYYGSTEDFYSGNVVEILFILFAPIFINRKYFFIVSFGLILQYILYGVLFKTLNVVFPIVVYIVLFGISFTLLTRFQSYIGTVKEMLNRLHQKERLAVIGQMATSVGHEIRNPLASLKGFTQLQMEKYPDDQEYFPIMLSEINRMNSIVTDLLVLGKPKSNTLYHKANINNIMEYTISITRQIAEQKNIEVHSNFSKEIPDITCEDNQLKQVFLNLLNNAIESMDGGGKININTELAQKQIVVSIQDQGCGIPKEDLDKLGSPFFTTKQNGTGLGLLVSKKIVEEHEGKISFESAPGDGTKVSVYFPYN